VNSSDLVTLQLVIKQLEVRKMVRFKCRYFLVEIERSGSIGKESVDLEPLAAQDVDVMNALKGIISDLHGDHGRAAVSSGLKIKYLNTATRVVLVKARHGGPDKIVSSCLPFLTYIQTESVVCRLLYTGATIRHCYKFLEKRQKKLLLSIIKGLTSSGEHNSKELEKAVLQVKKISGIHHN